MPKHHVFHWTTDSQGRTLVNGRPLTHQGKFRNPYQVTTEEYERDQKEQDKRDTEEALDYLNHHLLDMDTIAASFSADPAILQSQVASSSAPVVPILARGTKFARCLACMKNKPATSVVGCPHHHLCVCNGCKKAQKRQVRATGTGTGSTAVHCPACELGIK